MLHARKTANMRRNRYQPWLIIVNMVFLATCIKCDGTSVHQQTNSKRPHIEMSIRKPATNITEHNNNIFANLTGTALAGNNATGDVTPSLHQTTNSKRPNIENSIRELSTNVTEHNNKTFAICDTALAAKNATGYMCCNNVYVTMTSYGYLKSPNYPFNYDNNIDICWVIRASDVSKKVRLGVLASRMEGSSCSRDYVEVRNGKYSSSELILRFCGTTLPGPFTSSRSYLYVRFNTDFSITFSGFRMKTFAVAASECTEVDVRTSSTSYISSPNYPFNYPNNVNKCWILRAPFSWSKFHLLRLQVLSSTIEYSRHCSADYVEVRDGQRQSAPLKARFCGIAKPWPFTSRGRYMYVHFHTDGSRVDRGFRMSINAVPEGSNNGPRPIIIVVSISAGGIGFTILICIIKCCCFD